MSNKFVIGICVVSIALISGLFGYRLGSPEIRLTNQSGQVISRATLQLPSNNIVFENVDAYDIDTIFYSLAQHDGTSSVAIEMQSGKLVTGQCGYITQNEIGKRLDLILTANLNIECHESSKI